jgi:hypothetical protein
MMCLAVTGAETSPSKGEICECRDVGKASLR